MDIKHQERQFKVEVFDSVEASKKEIEMISKSCLISLLLLVAVLLALVFLYRDPPVDQCKYECKSLGDGVEGCVVLCGKYGGHGPASDSQKLQQYILCLDQCHWEAYGRFQEKVCWRQCVERLLEEIRGVEGLRYVFDEWDFTTKTETQRGRVRQLLKFTARSGLVEGMEDYRLGIVEAEPFTIVLPRRWVADAVIFVAQGLRTISLVHQDFRDSFSIRKGEVFRVPAGTTSCFINGDDTEKLIIVELLQPVSSPESFFGARGESYLQAFGVGILEATVGDGFRRARSGHFCRSYARANPGLEQQWRGWGMASLGRIRRKRVKKALQAAAGYGHCRFFPGNLTRRNVCSNVQLKNDEDLARDQRGWSFRNGFPSVFRK